MAQYGINANKVFPHRNYRIVFKLQNTPYFSAKNENFLSLALSQAMCQGTQRIPNEPQGFLRNSMEPQGTLKNPREPLGIQFEKVLPGGFVRHQSLF